MTDEGISVPRVVYTAEARVVEWGAPRYNAIYRVLTNQIYTGAYVYRRTGSQVRIEVGRKRIRRDIPRSQDKWEVLIHDHHEGYISWNDFRAQPADHPWERQHEGRYGEGIGPQW